jgi:hypothetical protein
MLFEISKFAMAVKMVLKNCQNSDEMVLKNCQNCDEILSKL